MKTLTIKGKQYSTDTVTPADWLEQRKYPDERLQFFYRHLLKNGWRIGRNTNGKSFEDSLEISSLALHYEYIDKLAWEMFSRWRSHAKIDDFTPVGIWRQMLSLRIVEYKYAEENDLAYIKTANRNADSAHDAGMIDDIYYLNLKWRISTELDFYCDTPPEILPGLRDDFLKTIHHKVHLIINDMFLNEKLIFNLIKKLISAGCNVGEFKSLLREISTHSIKVKSQYPLLKKAHKFPPLSTLTINEKMVADEFELNNIIVE